MLGPLHKLMLDAIDQLGAMTDHELQVACLIAPKQRGGFRSALVKLFERKLVYSVRGEAGWQIGLTKEGVLAVEAENVRQEGNWR